MSIDAVALTETTVLNSWHQSVKRRFVPSTIGVDAPGARLVVRTNQHTFFIKLHLEHLDRLLGNLSNVHVLERQLEGVVRELRQV